MELNPVNLEIFAKAITGFNAGDNRQVLDFSEKKALENFHEAARYKTLLLQAEMNQRMWYKTYLLAGGSPIDELEEELNITEYKLEIAPALLSPAFNKKVRRVMELNSGKSEDDDVKTKRTYNTAGRKNMTPEDYAVFYKRVKNLIGAYPPDSVVAEYIPAAVNSVRDTRMEAIDKGLIEYRAGKEAGYNWKRAGGTKIKILEAIGPWPLFRIKLQEERDQAAEKEPDRTIAPAEVERELVGTATT